LSSFGVGFERAVEFRQNCGKSRPVHVAPFQESQFRQVARRHVFGVLLGCRLRGGQVLDGVTNPLEDDVPVGPGDVKDDSSGCLLEFQEDFGSGRVGVHFKVGHEAFAGVVAAPVSVGVSTCVAATRGAVVG
jgi:hypothetical protein